MHRSKFSRKLNNPLHVDKTKHKLGIILTMLIRIVWFVSFKSLVVAVKKITCSSAFKVVLHARTRRWCGLFFAFAWNKFKNGVGSRWTTNPRNFNIFFVNNPAMAIWIWHIRGSFKAPSPDTGLIVFARFAWSHNASSHGGYWPDWTLPFCFERFHSANHLLTYIVCCVHTLGKWIYWAHQTACQKNSRILRILKSMLLVFGLSLILIDLQFSLFRQNS